MTLTLDYESKRTSLRARLPGRSKGAIALISVAILFWWLAKPFQSNRAYKGDLPWNLRHSDEVIWLTRLGRLSVLVAAYAVYCAWLGFRKNTQGAAMVLVVTVVIMLTMSILHWRSFGIPNAYWPQFDH